MKKLTRPSALLPSTAKSPLAAPHQVYDSNPETGFYDSSNLLKMTTSSRGKSLKCDINNTLLF
jgi:hypothetical protein